MLDLVIPVTAVMVATVILTPLLCMDQFMVALGVMVDMAAMDLFMDPAMVILMADMVVMVDMEDTALFMDQLMAAMEALGMDPTTDTDDDNAVDNLWYIFLMDVLPFTLSMSNHKIIKNFFTLKILPFIVLNILTQELIAININF